MQNILKIFLISFNFYVSTLAQCNLNLASFNYDPFIITTLSGKVRGECKLVEVNDPQNPSLTGKVFSWKGIPYAEPPINQYRFKKPRGVSPWNDIRNGSNYSKKCMQPGNPSDTNISEDCLYLNIFAPADAYLNAISGRGPRLPILIFIHGGKFIVGSSSRLSFDPSVNIVYSNIIVVTINYRLGPFGLMHVANTDISGNQGFLDQHLALRWIYENAHTFGGEKSRITLSGESAGSFSTSFHIVYKPSWPYFQNAILQSGTNLAPSTELYETDVSTKIAKAVLTNSGCNYDSFSNVNDFMTCVQNIDPQVLLNQSSTYERKVLGNNTVLGSELIPIFNFVLDGIEFKESIKTTMQKKDIKPTNILSGFTSHEYSVLLTSTGLFGRTPSEIESKANLDFNTFKNYLTEFFTYFPRYPLKPNSGFVDGIIAEYTQNATLTNYFTTFVQILSEYLFICPNINFARIMSGMKNSYVYTFEHIRSNRNYPKIYGSMHGEEIDFVFGRTMSKIVDASPPSLIAVADPVTSYTNEEREFSKTMISYWTNFVKSGNPFFGDRLVPLPWPFFTNLFLSLKANDIRIKNEFLFEDKPRHCNFWRAYENW